MSGTFLVTEEDRRMINYFLNEKGDIENWTQWEDRKGDIEIEYPEFIQALDQLEVAKRTLRAITKTITQDL